MALTLVTEPVTTVGAYDSDVSSTEQILFEFNEDALAGKDKYVLTVVIPEANNTTFYFLPDSNGGIKFDLGPSIAWLIPEGQNYLQYKLTYNADWDGGSTSPVNTQLYIAIRSRRQILTEYGSNLYNLTMKSVDKKGEWLSVFEEPILWRGWTQKAYIINPALSIFNVDEIAKDINKSTLTNNVVVYSAIAVPLVFAHTINEATGEYITLNAEEENDTVDYSEAITYRLKDECKHPIMIEWLNSNGGYDTYLFQYEQTFINEVEEGLKYNTPISETIETNTGNKFRYSDKDTQFITLKADQLNQNQLQALHDIKRSNEVRLWLNKGGELETGSITAMADAGGGIVALSSNQHGLSDGDEIEITGTTNYNGTYTVINDPPLASNFNIVATWVGSETGTWTKDNATVYINVTVNGGYTTDFTSGKNAYEFNLNIELPDNFDFFTAKEY